MQVLIATDGSQLAVNAARSALEVLRQPAGVTVVAAVSEAPGDDAGGIEGPTEGAEAAQRRWRQLQAEAEQTIDAVAVLVASPVVRRVEIGEPGPVICATAKEIDADVIVVGSHGRGLIRQVMVGSVSEYVLHHAPCPVIVVRNSHRSA